MLWDTVKNSLSSSLSESEYSLWIKPLSCVQEDDKTLQIACPDRFFCAWVKERYLGLIETNLGKITRLPPCGIVDRVNPSACSAAGKKRFRPVASSGDGHLQIHDQIITSGLHL